MHIFFPFAHPVCRLTGHLLEFFFAEKASPREQEEMDDPSDELY